MEKHTNNWGKPYKPTGWFVSLNDGREFIVSLRTQAYKDSDNVLIDLSLHTYLRDPDHAFDWPAAELRTLTLTGRSLWSLV